jgi:hypothetical protein
MIATGNAKYDTDQLSPAPILADILDQGANGAFAPPVRFAVEGPPVIFLGGMFWPVSAHRNVPLRVSRLATAEGPMYRDATLWRQVRTAS